MKFKIAGEQIQEMAAEEILDHVSASAYKRIKAADPKPVFRAYCIGHEGESTGKVVGMGRVVKRWARSAIEGINNKLAIGTKFFHMHGQETNDHDGRKPIAEVAGKALSDIAGKLSSIAIAYIYPAYHDIPLDVASIEADINMPESVNPNARAVDVDVEEITGIALGNSTVVSPGFAGATLLASLQEFADNADHGKRTTGGDGMTLDDLKKAVKEGKFGPSDLFSGEDLTNDSYVRDVIREGKDGEKFHRLRTDDKFREESAKWEQEKKDLQTKLDAANRGALKAKAAEAVKPAVEKRKLDEKQSAFILKHADKFEPKSEETLVGDLDKFLDGKLDELKGFAEIYGIKPGESGTAGIPAGKPGDTAVKDLLTPDDEKGEIKK